MGKPEADIDDAESSDLKFHAIVLGDLCEPNPCGTNAKCTPGHDRTGAERPVCTCPSGYIGNALVACDKVCLSTINPNARPRLDQDNYV